MSYMICLYLQKNRPTSGARVKPQESKSTPSPCLNYSLNAANSCYLSCLLWSISSKERRSFWLLEMEPALYCVCFLWSCVCPLWGWSAWRSQGSAIDPGQLLVDSERFGQMRGRKWSAVEERKWSNCRLDWFAGWKKAVFTVGWVLSIHKHLTHTLANTCKNTCQYTDRQTDDFSHMHNDASCVLNFPDMQLVHTECRGKICGSSLLSEKVWIDVDLSSWASNVHCVTEYIQLIRDKHDDDRGFRLEGMPNDNFQQESETITDKHKAFSPFPPSSLSDFERL